jgi:hypothetical protein
MKSTNYFDAQFDAIKGLTWYPWIGARVPETASSERLLIVGESHYTNEIEDDKLVRQIRELMADRNYTRDVVEECPVNLEWRNPTLENIERFILGGTARNRAELWSDITFYNFVQRPMAYGARKERPVWEDWTHGWSVFRELVAVLKPAHCIFIGVAAANSFDWAMTDAGVSFRPITRVAKVRRTWGRSAQITTGGSEISISFMRHCGAHFSWVDWHSFLRTQCDELINLYCAQHSRTLTTP